MLFTDKLKLNVYSSRKETTIWIQCYIYTVDYSNGNTENMTLTAWRQFKLLLKCNLNQHDITG